MILNPYALLAGSVGVLRLLLGVLLALCGYLVWRRWVGARGPEARAEVEDRTYLLLLLACFLAGLNLVSWPLLYLVLQSYVPEWPGVMCIYGVTRIGAGSVGPSGWLPALLQLLQVLKPALVFVTGLWLVLYGLHRRSRTPVLLARILLVLICLGVGSGLDSAAEAAYLVIPKKEEVLASGCCTVPPAGALTTAGAGLLPAAQQPWLLAAYFGANIGLVLAVARYRRSGGPGLGSLLALVLVVSVVSALFLTEVLAPRVLGQPEHHCAYDLVPRFPHLVLGAALFVWGSFSVGWAVVARRLASAPQLQHLMGAEVAAMVRRAQLGFVLSMVLISFGLLAAKW